MHLVQINLCSYRGDHWKSAIMKFFSKKNIEFKEIFIKMSLRECLSMTKAMTPHLTQERVKLSVDLSSKVWKLPPSQGHFMLGVLWRCLFRRN